MTVARRFLVTYGIYPDRQSFDRALEALRAAEFRASDIGHLSGPRPDCEDLAHEINTKIPRIGRGTGGVGVCSAG